MSSTSNGSRSGKKPQGGWVSPNMGVDGQYDNGQRRLPTVTEAQFQELKAAVVQLEMDEKINDDIIYKAC